MRLIDADALMEDINGSLNEMTNIGIMVDGDWLWGKLNDALENAPTVEERKTGKWRAFKIGECDLIECTACKVARPREAMPTRNGGKIAWKFCPECGAKMEDGDE